MSYVTPPSVLPVATACVSPGRGLSGSLKGNAVAALVPLPCAGAAAGVVAPAGGAADVVVAAPEAGGVVPRGGARAPHARGGLRLVPAAGAPPPPPPPGPTSARPGPVAPPRRGPAAAPRP